MLTYYYCPKCGERIYWSDFGFICGCKWHGHWAEERYFSEGIEVIFN